MTDAATMLNQKRPRYADVDPANFDCIRDYILAVWANDHEALKINETSRYDLTDYDRQFWKLSNVEYITIRCRLHWEFDWDVGGESSVEYDVRYFNKEGKLIKC